MQYLHDQAHYIDEVILTLFRILNSLNKKCKEIKIVQKKGWKYRTIPSQ